MIRMMDSLQPKSVMWSASRLLNILVSIGASKGASAVYSSSQSPFGPGALSVGASSSAVSTSCSVKGRLSFSMWVWVRFVCWSCVAWRSCSCACSFVGVC